MSRLRAFTLKFAAFLLLLLLCARVADAQLPAAPWNGVIGRESDDPNLPWNAQHRTFKDAISDDGRYVVFKRTFDVNGPGDIFVRDRYTRDVRKVNLAWDDSEPYAPSEAASISGNGRHVIFLSCGRLTLDDVNDVCDLYARDLEYHTITRISVGPQGQEPIADAGPGSITNDGRFIAFTAQFDAPYPGLPRYAWVRDRDPDHNGIFDEPGTTTTLVSMKADGTPATADYAVAINGGTAQYVAFTSSDPDVVPTPAGYGVHMYVRDLQNSMTLRIDTPTPGTADEGWSMWPDFSDNGRWLVYESTARVGETDVDSQSDVFIFDLWTGGNIQVPLDSAASENDRIMLPAISGDGRYVAVAAELDSTGLGTFYAWVYDRETRQATRIVPKAGGPLGHPSVMELSLTFDGSELLFWSDAYGVVHQYWPFGTAVFVWSPFALSLSEQVVPAGGGTFTAEVSAPPGVAWTATSPNEAWIAIQPASGNGPGSFTFTLPPNSTSESHTGYIWIGSEQIVVTQSAAPFITDVWPWDGPVTGGTTVSVVGGGFTDGSAVTFDGVAAAVNFVNGGLLEAVTPPHSRSGPVEVRVINPDGLEAARLPGFRYRDDSPPVVDYTFEGAEGANGYYVGDVTIRWTVTDPESDVSKQGCETRTFTEDGVFYQFCQAESEGGTTSRWVPVPRDGTGPAIQVDSPWYPPAQVVTRYPRGSAVSTYYVCSDSVSGVSTCVGDVPSMQNLDTSVAGTFTFTVLSEDLAGNRSTKAIPYIVVAPTALTLSDAAAEFGGTTSLVAQLTVDGHPLVGQIVTFAIAGTPLGTATTNPNGVATLPLPLGSRGSGVYPTSASFEEAGIYAAANAAASLAVNKAPVAVTWSTPAPIGYGTLLSGAQLNASASVPGTFVYTPALGSALPAGSHLLAVNFVPADSLNYESGSQSVQLAVLPAPLSIRANDETKVYGAPLPGFSVSGVGFVFGETLASLAGSASFSTSASSSSAPGTYAVTPGGLASSNYAISFVSGALTVTKAATLLTLSSSPNPSGNNKPVQLIAQIAVVAPGSGAPSGTVTFQENTTVLGTASIVNGVATVTVAFRKGTHPLTASWNGDANFAGSSGSSTHRVN